MCVNGPFELAKYFSFQNQIMELILHRLPSSIGSLDVFLSSRSLNGWMGPTIIW